MTAELAMYLDTQTVTSENIGDVRRSLFVPWNSRWNGIVRDLTAARESGAASSPAQPEPAAAWVQGSNPCPVCGVWLWQDTRPCWDCLRQRLAYPASEAVAPNESEGTKP